MPEPLTITAAALAGLVWVTEQAAASLLGHTTDRVILGTLRDLRTRITGFKGTAEAEDVVRRIRVAHIQALDELIRDFRSTGRPEWTREPHTRPDHFFTRSVAFCTGALHRARDQTEKPEIEAVRLSEGVDALLATPVDDGPAKQRSVMVAAAAEDAVLDELRKAMNGVVLPPGFEEHFRSGTGERPRFLDLFGAYVHRQIKENAVFRDLLFTKRLLGVEALAFDVRDLSRGMEMRFGGVLDRVELKLDEHSRMISEILARVSADKGVPFPVLRAILDRLGEANVEDDQIADRLAAKAEEYLALRAQWQEFASSRPDYVAVHTKVLACVDTGDLDGGRALLAEARARVRQSRYDYSRDEAALLADEANIDRLQLRYRNAAERYGEAASLVEPFAPETHFEYLVKQGNILQAQGVEFGDNDALRSATAVWRAASEQWSRETHPLIWVQIQNGLGTALAVLGDRENSASTLEQAATAFRAGLTAVSPEREPLEWVRFQNNLANVVQELGEREQCDFRFAEAVTAYSAALEVLLRVEEPHKWGMLQNNLGIAHLNVGRRKNNSESLQRAIAAFRAALEEWRRELNPLRWATAMHNLGNAWAALGKLENDKEPLEEALAIYHFVLEEWTRERVPLDWALVQLSLGNTLLVRGTHDEDEVWVSEAIDRFEAALQEVTRERAPFDWAIIQGNLGEALAELGKLGDSSGFLQAASAAFEGAREVFAESGADQHVKEMSTNLEHVGELLKKHGSPSDV